MAYFGFTNKLVKGETIKIFNYGNCKRDFTYVDDVGFRTADEIASHVGIRMDSDFRIRSGIQYALLQASNEGHTYLPMPELTQRASNLLQIEPEYIEKHYMNLAMDRKIIMRQVVSLILFAARPVGAARKMSMPSSSK